MITGSGISFALIAEAIGGLAIATLIASVGALLFRGPTPAKTRSSAQPTAPGDLRSVPRSVIKGGEHAAPVASPSEPSQLIFSQLTEYYTTNLAQCTGIFWASLISMCIGFVIVIVGVVSIGANGVTAIVAAIAGVLSQFIAATFLVALRSTQQQATAYTQSLVELRLRDQARVAEDRSIALGLDLLAQISDDRSNPANPTKAAIAMGLIVRVPPAVPEPPGITVEVPKLDDGAAERRSRAATVTYEDTGPVQPR